MQILPPPLSLSKTLELADYLQLGPQLAVVDTVGIAGQHEHRRWEYALALLAIQHWRATRSELAFIPRLYDVGGAGSSFYLMVNALAVALAEVVDPDAPIGPFSRPITLHDFCALHPPQADLVTCLSVLEHVKDWRPFLADLLEVLRPGGLLFLTFDSCDCTHAPEEDPHHFHWMRERIATPAFRSQLLDTALDLGASCYLGAAVWGGAPTVYDYSFSSLALIKESR